MSRIIGGVVMEMETAGIDTLSSPLQTPPALGTTSPARRRWPTSTSRRPGYWRRSCSSSSSSSSPCCSSTGRRSGCRCPATVHPKRSTLDVFLFVIINVWRRVDIVELRCLMELSLNFKFLIQSLFFNRTSRFLFLHSPQQNRNRV